MIRMRVFRRAPAFAVLAVAILAAGIGASTVMYTLVEHVLLRDLPFQDPGRLVWVYNTRTERDRAPLSIPDLEDYRRESTSLAGLAVFTNWTTNLTGAGTPERLDGVRVSGNFFALLGTDATIGRTLQPDDELRESRVAVLTHGLWQRRFGGRLETVGEAVVLNGATYTIVGVLPPRFLFPFREAEVAVPIALQRDSRRVDRGANFLRVVGRLAPGVTAEAADADLDAIAARLQRRYPEANARKIGISLYPLHAEIVRDYGGMLRTLFASVGVLLLAGCVNLANLLLVRAAERQTELSLRAALGASRGRLARLLFGEATALAVAGGIAGLAVAYAGVAAWRLWGPADFPQMSAIAIDIRVLMFVALITGLTAVVCGVAPAWIMSGHSGRGNPMHVRTTTMGRTQRRVQGVLVAAQLASATVLLVGMLLMGRGFARLERVSPGFSPDQALSLQLSLPPARYANREAIARFCDALRDRLQSIPGVEHAGAVSLLPLSGLLSTADVALLDRPAPPPDNVPQAHLRIATGEYFRAAGIALREGRPFDRRDRRDGQPVAIVSRTFAARHWPGTTAIGQSVRIIQAVESPALEIVGMVDDVKQFSVDGPATADLYVPLEQMPAFQAPLLAARMYWVVRARGDEASTVRDIRTAVTAVDTEVAASSVRTLESLWSASLGSRRANVRVLQVFGNVALVLCAIGVYGVAAFAARTRRRELAIRSALGASRGRLLVSMLRRDLSPVVAGVAVGLLAALVAAPDLFAGAFEMSPFDPATYVEVALVLVAVGALATCVPLRRAGATSPSDVLAG